uniref:Uncharacterized protein n=1 Tax=Stomoxys calcitrans TaxID=35570 RepID=A0A1I8P853_STOCA
MALKAKIYIFALVASILVVISETKKPGKVMYFTSTKVEFNRIYISEHSLDIVGNTTLDIILNLAQNYKYDPWSKTVIAMKNRKTNEYRTLLDYDVNICSLLGKGSATYISMWIQNFLKYGNLPKTCPIMK